MNITKEKAGQLGKQIATSTYTNRHYLNKTVYTFNLEALHTFCNAAIEHYIAQQTSPTKVTVLESAIKDLARWLEAGATISKREGATNCMVMQEDGSILGGLHVDFSQVVNQPICPDCKAEGLLYKCVHCSANNYPDTPKP